MMAGAVFLWEGILKFVYVNQGVGRFTKLGIPFPLVTAPFVAGLEIVGGIFQLECDTREEAVAIAEECPATEWATIEIRRIAPCFEDNG